MSPTIQFQVFSSQTILSKHNENQLLYVMVIANAQGTPITFKRIPLNLCLVIDRSTSMRGERLNEVKQAVHYIIDQLEGQDYLSLITFNDYAQVVIPSQQVINKVKLKTLVNDISAEGGTEMSNGLDMAIKQIRSTSQLHGASHIILLTDGRTYGDESRCIQLAQEMQQDHIGLTALGIGNEWNEDLLEVMAANETSRTRYLTSAYDIVDVFADELKRMFSTFIHGVQLLIEGRSDSIVRSFDRVQPYISPIDYQGEHNVRWLGKLGDWNSTDTQAFLLETLIPPLEVGNHLVLNLTLRYRIQEQGKQSGVKQTSIPLHITIIPEKVSSSDIDITIRHWVERLTAYRLQVRAWKNVEIGRVNEAAKQLHMAGTRLLSAGQTELAQTIQQEATRLLQSGKTSSEGRKRIKYGTRGLIRETKVSKNNP